MGTHYTFQIGEFVRCTQDVDPDSLYAVGIGAIGFIDYADENLISIIIPRAPENMVLYGVEVLYDFTVREKRMSLFNDLLSHFEKITDPHTINEAREQFR